MLRLSMASAWHHFPAFALKYETGVSQSPVSIVKVAGAAQHRRAKRGQEEALERRYLTLRYSEMCLKLGPFISPLYAFQLIAKSEMY